MVVVAFIGGVGGWELLLVLAVILVIFGPERLPEMARRFAEISGRIRLANRDLQRQMYRNLDLEDEDARRPGAGREPEEAGGEEEAKGSDPAKRSG